MIQERLLETFFEGMETPTRDPRTLPDEGPGSLQPNSGPPDEEVMMTPPGLHRGEVACMQEEGPREVAENIEQEAAGANDRRTTGMASVELRHAEHPTGERAIGAVQIMASMVDQALQVSVVIAVEVYQA